MVSGIRRSRTGRRAERDHRPDLASAVSAILVCAQELVPGKVGTMSGLFFGLAFGLGGIGSAVLGAVADRQGIQFVSHIWSYLPLIGLLTALLPNLGTPRRGRPL
jgi:MFS transporter, FSR family, fosmidomycin resistance protein